MRFRQKISKIIRRISGKSYLSSPHILPCRRPHPSPQKHSHPPISGDGCAFMWVGFLTSVGFSIAWGNSVSWTNRDYRLGRKPRSWDFYFLRTIGIPSRRSRRGLFKDLRILRRLEEKYHIFNQVHSLR